MKILNNLFLLLYMDVDRTVALFPQPVWSDLTKKMFKFLQKMVIGCDVEKGKWQRY